MNVTSQCTPPSKYVPQCGHLLRHGSNVVVVRLRQMNSHEEIAFVECVYVTGSIGCNVTLKAEQCIPFYGTITIESKP